MSSLIVNLIRCIRYSYGPVQLAPARARAAAWGVKLGSMTFEEGDMLTSPGVDEALKRASVVVCNNKMFSESCTFYFSPRPQ